MVQYRLRVNSLVSFFHLLLSFRSATLCDSIKPYSFVAQTAPCNGHPMYRVPPLPSSRSPTQGSGNVSSTLQHCSTCI